MSKKLTYGSENITSLYVGSQKVKKIYAGSELVYESTPPAMPVKGDIIQMNTHGNTESFRVLSINNTIANVICMNFFTGINYDPYTDIYDGSKIQKYLNETFYETFNSTAKRAIVPIDLPKQRGYAISGTSNHTYIVIKRTGSAQNISWSKTYRVSTNQKVYLPAAQDFGEYLGATSTDDASTTPFTYNNVMTLLYNDTTRILNTSISLRDRQNNSETSPLSFSLDSGEINSTSLTTTSLRIHYLTNIDLSKISFTIITPSIT